MVKSILDTESHTIFYQDVHKGFSPFDETKYNFTLNSINLFLTISLSSIYMINLPLINSKDSKRWSYFGSSSSCR